MVEPYQYLSNMNPLVSYPPRVNSMNPVVSNCPPQTVPISPYMIISDDSYVWFDGLSTPRIPCALFNVYGHINAYNNHTLHIDFYQDCNCIITFDFYVGFSGAIEPCTQILIHIPPNPFMYFSGSGFPCHYQTTIAITAMANTMLELAMVHPALWNDPTIGAYIIENNPSYPNKSNVSATPR